MLVQVANAHKKKKPAASKDSPNGSKPSAGGGTTIATAEAPRPAAVVFTLGSSRIEVDPRKFYEAHILYLDLKEKLGFKEDFSSFLLEATGLVWKVMAPAPQPDGKDAFKGKKLEVIIE